MNPFNRSSGGALVKANSRMGRECIGGKWLILDAEEKGTEVVEEETLCLSSSY